LDFRVTVPETQNNFSIWLALMSQFHLERIIAAILLINAFDVIKNPRIDDTFTFGVGEVDPFREILMDGAMKLMQSVVCPRDFISSYWRSREGNRRR
jgi:hypothetical protein